MKVDERTLGVSILIVDIIHSLRTVEVVRVARGGIEAVQVPKEYDRDVASAPLSVRSLT